MLRIFNVCLMLLAVLFVGVVLFASAARLLMPPSAFALLFTNPQGTPCPGPCMFGIQMNKTTYEEALDLLRRHPLTKGMLEEQSVSRSGVQFYAQNVTIGLSRNAQGSVDLIFIQIDPFAVRAEGRFQGQTLPDSGLSRSTFGDMLASLNAPNYVEWRFSGRGQFGTFIEVTSTYYTDRFLRVVHKWEGNDRLKLSSPMTQLFMARQAYDVDPDMRPWRGLKDRYRYFDP
jgi:hypothetical protein